MIDARIPNKILQIYYPELYSIRYNAGHVSIFFFIFIISLSLLFHRSYSKKVSKAKARGLYGLYMLSEWQNLFYVEMETVGYSATKLKQDNKLKLNKLDLT